jgi:hypothetical protein
MADAAIEGSKYTRLDLCACVGGRKTLHATGPEE